MEDVEERSGSRRRGRIGSVAGSIHRKVLWRAYFIILSVIGIFTTGTLGFMYLEPGMTPLEAFHLTMQTVTTVGYGDIAITTEGGRLFSDLLMVFGLAVATFGVASLLEFVVSGKLREAMRTKDYDGMIRRMRRHIIICGYGRVGQSVLEELRKRDIPAVVVEMDEGALDDLPADIPRISGSSTEDPVLIRAGIQRATGVIAATGKDADNLMTLVTAKYIHPRVIAIARSSFEEDDMKFLKVGADMVVSPETEGGKSMAKMLEEAERQVIIGGYGRVGRAVADALVEMEVPVMVMERSGEVLDDIPSKIRHMEGDVTKEEDLRRAGIGDSTAVVPVCGEDAANLLATVTAKYHKPSVTVITRASSTADVSKMLKVGADIVISPEIEGGKSLARWAAQAYELSEQG